MAAEEERTSTPCETVREEDEDQSEQVQNPQDKKQVEKQEEEKLKAKYPNLAKGSGGSALLNKRLQRGGKYFDSGDYAMAKAQLNNKSKLPTPPEKIIKTESVGQTIPTPDNIPAARCRKPSLVTSKLASGELL
ncbi:hypothetical protein RRG08_056859 [Elysia crispata]|uniref:cAMP-regulated phosphoprotein 19 n=1 Tax=Elysia crispata TaxID=231223 RepID=A0AAE1DWG4_9GAST|nr:hypothetical protein RRG08_056859 [Elysia crispata]